ncbi:MAG: Zn-ribbon containing protein [Nanoarchaeota archaeon]
MPHQCTKCSRIIPVGSKELLEGCADCNSHFFFYIRDEQFENLKNKIIEIPEKERVTIEKDIREMAGITDDEQPVILDIESIRAVGTGKYEIDVVNLFNKERPLIYKVSEGKYVIDLASTLKGNLNNSEDNLVD